MMQKSKMPAGGRLSDDRRWGKLVDPLRKSISSFKEFAEEAEKDTQDVVKNPTAVKAAQIVSSPLFLGALGLTSLLFALFFSRGGFRVPEAISRVPPIRSLPAGFF